MCEMKKTMITLAVLLAVSLICTVCFGTALGSQGIRAFFRDDGVLDSWVERMDNWSETAVHVNDWNDIDDLFDEDSRAYLFDSQEVELPAGDTLSLYADCGDIRILRGTGDTVKATLEQYSRRNSPTSKYALETADESTLRLKAQPNLNGVGARLTVYLPQQLTNLNVEVSAGDVRLEDLTADTLHVKLNAGDLDLTRITAKQISLTVDAGDVDIGNGVTASESFTLDCACGDVNFVLPPTVPFTLDYTVQTGDVEIDPSVNQGYIRSANRNGAHCTGSLTRASTDGTAESVIQLYIDLGDLDITLIDD